MKFFEKIFGIKQKKIDLTNRNDYAINLNMDNIVYLHDKKSKPYMNALIKNLEETLDDITKDIQKTVVSFQDKKKDLRRRKMGAVRPIMTREEFNEISNEIDELDKLYVNNPLEYAKRLLGEERVKELLQKNKKATHNESSIK